MKKIFLVLLFLLLPVVSEAATYWVATGGGVTGTCHTAQGITDPGIYLRTINTAVACVGPNGSRTGAGNTVVVKAGIYAERLDGVMPAGTSWSAPFTLKANPGERVTIAPTGSGYYVITFAHSASVQYVVLDGFILDCTNTTTGCITIQGGANRIRVQNCELKNSPGFGILGGGYSEFINLKVHHNGRNDHDHGFYFNEPNNLIDGSEIHQNSGYGVHLYGNPGRNHNTVIRNSRIYANNTSGGYAAGIIVGSGDNIQVHDNRIYSQSPGHGSSGISVNYGATNAKIYNNTITGNPHYGIDVGDQGVTNTVIQNNTINSNGAGSIRNRGTGTVIQPAFP